MYKTPGGCFPRDFSNDFYSSGLASAYPKDWTKASATSESTSSTIAFICVYYFSLET